MLLDSHCNLKIADFGVAALLAGDDKKGFFTKRVGTDYCMAPELFASQEYNGVEVDLFASAVTLFTMVAGIRPFKNCTKSDQHYSLIMDKNPDRFWRKHAINTKKVFSEDFKNLITSML